MSLLGNVGKLNNKRQFDFFFFLDILNELKEKGKIARRPKALIDRLLQTPLVCNQCPDRFDSLGGLKSHLDNHWLEKSFKKINIA